MFGGFQRGAFQPLPAFQQVEPAAEPAGGHYWPTKRKRRRDPLDERIEAARQAAEELREQLNRAIYGEPVEPAVVAEIAQEPVKLAPVVIRDTEALQAIRSDLARTERQLARYEAVERARKARIAELESFIDSTSAAVYEAIEGAADETLRAIESELQGEAKRLQKLLVKRLN